jgi:hypothetical protein
MAGWELEVPNFYCACAAVCKVFLELESRNQQIWAACLHTVFGSAWRFLVADVGGAGSRYGHSNIMLQVETYG